MSNNQANKYKNIKLLIRIIISIMLLAFFATQVDLKETIKLILSSNYIYLIICVLIYMVGQAICAYKWKLITKVAGYRKTLSEHIEYYFIGMFFNLFLPSTIGGDVGKAYYLYKNDKNGRKSTAVYSVIAERFTGLSVLVWLGTIATVTPAAAPVPFIFKFLGISLTLTILIGSPLFPGFIKKFFKPDHWLNRKLLNDVLVFWDHTLIAKCLFWSLISHLLIVVIHILIGLSINLHLPIGYYFIFYPIVSIIGFLPISFNGIGIREGSYIYFLSLIGISQGAGFAFGLLWFVIIVITSLIGGIFYIKGSGKAPLNQEDLEDFNLETLEKN